MALLKIVSLEIQRASLVAQWYDRGAWWAPVSGVAKSRK